MDSFATALRRESLVHCSKQLLKVNESGEFKRGTIAESKERRADRYLALH
ncbi:hypothetical protein [Pseudorhodoplanes sp.]